MNIKTNGTKPVEVKPPTPPRIIKHEDTVYERTLYMGKVDGYGNGRKDCDFEITVRINYTRLEYDQPRDYHQRLFVDRFPHKRPTQKTVDLAEVSDYYQISFLPVVWDRLRTDHQESGQSVLARYDSSYTTHKLLEWQAMYGHSISAGTSHQTEVIETFYALPFPSREFDQWVAGIVYTVDAGAETTEDRIARLRREAELIQLKAKYHADKRRDYGDAKEILTACGLFEHNGYRYGSQWLVTPIDPAIVQMIRNFVESFVDQPRTPGLLDRVKIANIKQTGRQSSGRMAGMYGAKVTFAYQGRQATFEWYAGEGHLQPMQGIQPTVHDVIGCLVNELYLLDYDLDDLCAELGYKPSEGQRVLKAVERNRDKLQTLFGPDYEELVNGPEDDQDDDNL